ncbi:STAS/SEC14 domain-containing protein [Myxococcus sp. K15C18031901]|uniref:STAS/SEC14 domain-containing protein n=1 Tax=Myxococcus dinghuensis TaxID=2906761 RepID=UPI0020A70514|nr:STAS/SEC14 domain-containing protein [Myxococcus dinghuensis]MCP3103983.1 STAS/SEC14 domain-containing protein [Myxococcus dinghuensis]
MQQQEWKIGSHHIRFEPPDVAVAVFTGPLTLEDMKRTVEIYGQMAKNGPYYLIADIGGSQLHAEARRYLSDNTRADWFHGCVYVGADLVQQTFGKVISLGLFLSGKTEFKTEFVKTLEDARVWVDTQRRANVRKSG